MGRGTWRKDSQGHFFFSQLDHGKMWGKLSHHQFQTAVRCRCFLVGETWNTSLFSPWNLGKSFTHFAKHSFQVGGKEPPPFYPVKLSRVRGPRQDELDITFLRKYKMSRQELEVWEPGIPSQQKSGGLGSIGNEFTGLSIIFLEQKTQAQSSNRALICPTGIVWTAWLVHYD